MTSDAQNRAIHIALGHVPPCGDTPELHDMGDWTTQEVPAPFRHRRCRKCFAIHLEGERYIAMPEGLDMPDYLDDANAAVMLCAKLAVEGWRCEINKGLDPTWECEFKRPSQSSTERHNIGEYGAGDTMSVAICEAFLRVKGLWKE